MQPTTSGFVLPEPKPLRPRHFILRPKALRAWHRELPVASTGETARHLYLTLREANRLRLPWRKRLDFLHFIRAILDETRQSLETPLAQAHFPLSKRERKHAQMLQGLGQEAALGYKLSIEEQLQLGRLRQRRRALAQAMVGALDYQGRMLLGCYAARTVLPARAWQDLHRLYRLAEAHKLLDTPALESGKHRLTARQGYLRALLAAIAAGSGLSVAEVKTTYRALGELAGEATLTLPPADKKNRYAVDLDRDAEPFPSGLHRLDEKHTPRVLILDALVEQLQRAQGAPEGPLARQLGPQLLDKLCRLWTSAPVRAADRRPGRGSPAEVLFGMPAIHRALDTAANGRIAPRLDQGPAFRSRSVEPTAAATGPRDVWNLFEPSPELARSAAGTAPPAPETPDTTAANVLPECWEVLDYSSGGYRLGSVGRRQRRITTDELVAVRTGEHWELGTVRWLKGNASVAEVGIGITAARVRPLAVCRHRSSVERLYQSALLLVSEEAGDQPATIALPAQFYAPGDRLRVYDGRKERALRLLRRTGFLGPLACFAFGRGERAAEEPAAPDAGPVGNAWKSGAR